MRVAYYKIWDHTVHTLDASLSGIWSPAPKVAVSLGFRVNVWKFVNVDRRQRNEVNILARGPFLSLELQY